MKQISDSNDDGYQTLYCIAGHHRLTDSINVGRSRDLERHNMRRHRAASECQCMLVSKTKIPRNHNACSKTINTRSCVFCYTCTPYMCTSLQQIDTHLRFSHEGFDVLQYLVGFPLVRVTVPHHATMIHKKFLKVPGQIGLSHRRPDDVISGVRQVSAGTRTSRAQMLKNWVRVPAVHVYF